MKHKCSNFTMSFSVLKKAHNLLGENMKLHRCVYKKKGKIYVQWMQRRLSLCKALKEKICCLYMIFAQYSPKHNFFSPLGR